jgi:hypothetical protein
MTGDLQSEIGGKHDSEHGRHTMVIGTTGPVVTFQSMSGDLRVVKPVLVERVSPSPRPGPSSAPAAPAGIADAPNVNGAIAAAYDDARLRILRSLERGEIDVAEAGRRLEQLDAGDAASSDDADIQSAPDHATTSPEHRSNG